MKPQKGEQRLLNTEKGLVNVLYIAECKVMYRLHCLTELCHTLHMSNSF